MVTHNIGSCDSFYLQIEANVQTAIETESQCPNEKDNHINRADQLKKAISLSERSTPPKSYNIITFS